MFRRAIALSLIAVSLAACQHSPAPASVAGGECKIFADPGFRVLGATADDQRWITRTQETGIRSCGWPRPAKRQALPPPVEEPPAAVSVEPAPRAPWYRRWLTS
jgi:hypothetical protein